MSKMTRATPHRRHGNGRPVGTPRKQSGPRRATPRSRPAGPGRLDASFPEVPPRAQLPGDYGKALAALEARVEKERLGMVVDANAAAAVVYWEIGRVLAEREASAGWGEPEERRLAQDLAAAFPDMRCFTPRCLRYMKAFAAAWPDRVAVERVAGRLPWTHNCLLLDAVDDQATRAWYASEALSRGWSRTSLYRAIDERAHERLGSAVPEVAPPAQSDLAAQILADPYLFDFLGTGDPRRVREREQGLAARVERALLGLGAGFALVGRRVQLVVGHQDLFVDLLFFHVGLRCHVVVALDDGNTDPIRDAELDLWLRAADDLLHRPGDPPSIGLRIRARDGKCSVEYARRAGQPPLAPAGWEAKVSSGISAEPLPRLPTVAEIEAELAAR